MTRVMPVGDTPRYRSACVPVSLRNVASSAQETPLHREDRAGGWRPRVPARPERDGRAEHEPGGQPLGRRRTGWPPVGSAAARNTASARRRRARANQAAGHLLWIHTGAAAARNSSVIKRAGRRHRACCRAMAGRHTSPRGRGPQQPQRCRAGEASRQPSRASGRRCSPCAGYQITALENAAASANTTTRSRPVPVRSRRRLPPYAVSAPPHPVIEGFPQRSPPSQGWHQDALMVWRRFSLVENDAGP